MSTDLGRYASAVAAASDQVPWPDGEPWRLLVARDGTLLVVRSDEAPPRRDVFAVASAESERRAWALALLLGHRTAHHQARVDSFPGTVGAALELRALLAQRTRREPAA
jgi:hypothetical protein